MVREELFNLFGFMGREIVGNNVDLFAAWLIGDQICQESDKLLTGVAGGYRFLKEYFPHEAVSHGAGEYVRGEVHTNNLESFWSLFKRGVMGSFHHVSKKYLPLYLAEFQFRHNDKAVSRYESSQSFNLVDLGALFLAGPLGLAVTKGYNFGSIFQSSVGSSQIRTLVSKWNVQRGVAQAKDVAMATRENRIALKGGLDFVKGRFKEVTVALIDTEGCPRVEQKIRGSFSKPEVEKPGILTSLAGPARKLLREAKGLFGWHCHVFYAGSVAPPR